MDAWSQILSGAKTHALALAALGFVIAMKQSGDVSWAQAGFLGSIACAFSTLRFAIKKNGGRK